MWITSVCTSPSRMEWRMVGVMIGGVSSFTGKRGVRCLTVGTIDSLVMDLGRGKVGVKVRDGRVWLRY